MDTVFLVVLKNGIHLNNYQKEKNVVVKKKMKKNKK